ncbi:cupin domain-containing protein [Vulcanimicrobium alpinum]|nr:cupin domain-containing protein [Vulcanimicrobium alpinum]
MRQTVVRGVWSWSRWQPDRNLDFNGFFIETDDGNLVVDPVEPDEETLASLRERGIAAVLITNRDHERASAAVAAATGAVTIASALDAPLLAAPVQRTVVPGDVVHGWTVIGLDGFKTAGEIALYDRSRAAALVGDALWGTPAGALTLMPDAKLADPVRAMLSARALRALWIDHLLVGDGACVFGNAHAAIGAMIDARDGLLAARINADELDPRRTSSDFAPYTAAVAEVGRLLGAKKLGYALGVLRRGDHYAPMHWHTREEELFVVLRGTPTLRTPHGTFALRPHDIVAFPTGAHGAHRLWNEADEDALVLMIANTDRGDVCYYPDSRKVLVESTGTLVRSEPELDYFEGET